MEIRQISLSRWKKLKNWIIDFSRNHTKTKFQGMFFEHFGEIYFFVHFWANLIFFIFHNLHFVIFHFFTIYQINFFLNHLCSCFIKFWIVFLHFVILIFFLFFFPFHLSSIQIVNTTPQLNTINCKNLNKMLKKKITKKKIQDQILAIEQKICFSFTSTKCLTRMLGSFSRVSISCCCNFFKLNSFSSNSSLRCNLKISNWMFKFSKIKIRIGNFKIWKFYCDWIYPSDLTSSFKTFRTKSTAQSIVGLLAVIFFSVAAVNSAIKTQIKHPKLIFEKYCVNFGN